MNCLVHCFMVMNQKNNKVGNRHNSIFNISDTEQLVKALIKSIDTNNSLKGTKQPTQENQYRKDAKPN